MTRSTPRETRPTLQTVSAKMRRIYAACATPLIVAHATTPRRFVACFVVRPTHRLFRFIVCAHLRRRRRRIAYPMTLPAILRCRWRLRIAIQRFTRERPCVRGARHMPSPMVSRRQDAVLRDGENAPLLFLCPYRSRALREARRMMLRVVRHIQLPGLHRDMPLRASVLRKTTRASRGPQPQNDAQRGAAR